MNDVFLIIVSILAAFGLFCLSIVISCIFFSGNNERTPARLIVSCKDCGENLEQFVRSALWWRGISEIYSDIVLKNFEADENIKDIANTFATENECVTLEESTSGA